MIKKVIYISYVRLSDKMSRDWFIDYLIYKGIAVEYWDVVALVRDEYEEAAAKTTDYLRTFRTYGELEEALRLPENKNSYYVMVVVYAGFTIRLFRLLTKYNCSMLYIEWGAVPYKSINRWRRLLFSLNDPQRLVKKLFYMGKAIVYKKLKLIKPFVIVCVAGKQAFEGDRYATKRIAINYADYDLYKKVKLESATSIVEGRYAVFLDSYLPHHLDIKLAGWPPIMPTEYYASLSRFFEQLEVQYKISVVIAAHPRSDYSASKPFGGRQVYTDRTAELVKSADFVIVHSSYSQSHAVLNSKPIVFIYTNEMLAAYKHTLMNEIFDSALYLDAAIYNIDKITQSRILIKNVNLVRYESYKYEFLTTRETEHTTSQEIFWHTISTEGDIET